MPEKPDLHAPDAAGAEAPPVKKKSRTSSAKVALANTALANTAPADTVAVPEVVSDDVISEETDNALLDASESNVLMRTNGNRSLTKDDQKSMEFALRTAQERNVKFIQLWFCDILGTLKSVAIIADELETALEEGITFDGSAIEGFARQDESDMLVLPDPNTFRILPFAGTEESPAARMFCDIVMPDGSSCETDSRFVLRKQLQAAATLGYTFYVGPEVEFFYIKPLGETGSPRPEPLDQGGYFDLTAMDVAAPLRRKTAITLEKLDIGVESSHHEGAPSQHEIDLRYTDALSMADSLMTFRLVVKEVAAESGCYATFMPKPMAQQNGSGMHINMSLFKKGKNIFFDPKDDEFLSDVARKYIAGLLRHARELTLFTNQWVNSYKRLVPGFEAPTRITWAQRNRADLVRVPSFKPGRETSRRVEYRSPDPACNPYLVFALLLAAGLEGIKNNYELPNESEEEASILPADLNEAIKAAEGSELARRVLGDVLFEKFLANKRMEWNNYRSQVHQYELDRYLSIL